ncbi:MAG: flagellar hook-basal body complex protein FliE [Alteromonadaceae bacterium]|jgi:flagellar hook-basal body complex protein FliE
MDIKTNSLFAQMQSMSLEAMNHKVGSIPSDSNAIPSINKSGEDFGNMLKDAINTVSDIQKDVGVKRAAFERGDTSVTLADVMIAGSKSGIAFDATVQIRNKFVEAYKEIMSMPV